MSSYRRDHVKSVAWTKWRRRAHDWLIASGIPSYVYEDDRTWQYFIGRGETRDLSYWPSGDPELLKSFDRQVALLQAVITSPGAPENAAKIVLAPYSFPLLWRNENSEFIFSEEVLAQLGDNLEAR